MDEQLRHLVSDKNILHILAVCGVEGEWCSFDSLHGVH